jgi:hypothetical protein
MPVANSSQFIPKLSCDKALVFTNQGMPLSYLTGDNNFLTTPEGKIILKRVGDYPTTLK